MNEFDHIVIGLGGIGSATAYRLARRGARVLGIEQFELGHDRGASQDHTRIIRVSQHAPAYVRFIQQAYAAWTEIERESGEQLLFTTGGLDIAPSEADFATHVDTMTACGIPFETMDGDAVTRRWPQFRFGADVRALYQADAGFVAAARANAVHQRLARHHGASLRERTLVTSVRSVDGEVEVTAGGVTYRAGKVVLAPDAWVNSLLAPLGHRLPLVVTQEQVVYYHTRDPDAFGPERFPIWIWWGEPGFYGIPGFGGSGPKAGQDIGGREVTAESRTFTPDAAASDRLNAFLASYLPDLRSVILVKTCLYTLTPDRGFVLDVLPGHPNVLVALGASHGYKFVPAFGQVLADLCLDGRTGTDIAAFRIDRPILQHQDPARNYHI